MKKNGKDKIFRSECASICGINILTWDKYVKKKLIIPDGIAHPNWKWFYRYKVEAFAATLTKKRRPGLPYILQN